MTKYLDLALEYLGVDKGSCLVLRETEDEVIVVVDKGIAGCPKYKIPLSELTVMKDVPLPIPEPVIDVDISESPRFSDIENMDYRQLQELAKERSIPANQTRDDLITALSSDEEE